jgi:hypothetical protein
VREGIATIIVGVLFILIAVWLSFAVPGSLIASAVIVLIAIGPLAWGTYCYRESGKESREIETVQAPQLVQTPQPQYPAPVPAQQFLPPSPSPSQSSVVVNVPAAPAPMVLMKCSHCGTVGNLLTGKCPSCGAGYL